MSDDLTQEPACIAVFNAGSSSLKFALYDASDRQELLFRGQIERINSAAHLKVVDAGGTVVDERQFKQDLSYLEIGKKEGAHLIHGGEVLTRKTRGHYLDCALFTETSNDMRINREEIFGPIAAIIRVRDYDEALAVANDTEYGLTASIWTKDMDAAERIGADIETGTVYQNRCDYLDPGLAWTGVKDTGRGATLSRVGYESLTRPKSFHLREV